MQKWLIKYLTDSDTGKIDSRLLINRVADCLFYRTRSAAGLRLPLEANNIKSPAGDFQTSCDGH